MNQIPTLRIFGGIGGPEIIIVLLAIGIGFLPKIFYLITLQNTMNAVRPGFRKMPPGTSLARVDSSVQNRLAVF